MLVTNGLGLEYHPTIQLEPNITISSETSEITVGQTEESITVTSTQSSIIVTVEEE